MVALVCAGCGSDKHSTSTGTSDFVYLYDNSSYNATGSGAKAGRTHAHPSQSRTHHPTQLAASSASDIASGTVDLYYYDATTQTSTQLNTASSYFCNVQLSNDGTKLLISAEDTETGDCQLYLADAKYQTINKLTTDADDHYDASISPDGTIIAYDDWDGDLYTLPAAGGTPTELTITGVGGGYSPVFTPDNKHIVFEGCENACNIYIVSASGGAATQLSQGTYWDGVPAVSPDGTKVVFDREAVSNGYTRDIAIISINGESTSSPATILSTDSSVSGGSWAPMFAGSGKLLFQSWKPNSDTSKNDNIFEINTDGTGLTRITNTLYETCFNWAWWDD
jgi:Tol biopolymer transport system component